MRLLTSLLKTRSKAKGTPNQVRAITHDLAGDSIERRACLTAEITKKVEELTASGRLSAALALLNAQLAANPVNGDLLFARASTLFAWARYAEAHACLLTIISFGNAEPRIYAKLGWTQLWLGLLDRASESMLRALQAEPDDWGTQFGLATVLRAQKKPAESKMWLERALNQNPSERHCLSSLIACELDLHNWAQAERLARRGVEQFPDSHSAFADLGMALSSQERHEEAIAAFAHAEALANSPNMLGDDVVNYAICLLRAGRTQQAISKIEAVLPVDPRAALHSHYALALLASGRLSEGFEQYEFRWLEPPLLSARPNFLKPQWAGHDLVEKTILIWSEQGFGDFIQFIRYAQIIKARGAKVVVFVREELRELATTVSFIDQVLGPNEPYPAFDYWINLLSIPRVLNTELASIPSTVPYLRANCGRATAHIGNVDTRLKVGFVWAGSSTHLRDRYRSLPLESLAPLLDIDSVSFYSLQKGPSAAALDGINRDGRIINLGRSFRNFADTAAAIEKLDLVIGVDTAVIHLAGAMAKPVWVMIPTPADWRWLEDRDDSPWYPTMRLFRQTCRGDWAAVVSRMRCALEDSVYAKSGHLVSVATEITRAVKTQSPLPIETEKVADLSRVRETRVGIIQYLPMQEGVGRGIELYGEYRQQELEAFGLLIVPGTTVLEVNAGIGVHALWLSRQVGETGHLYLYEGDQKYRRLLEQNIRSNECSNVTLMKRNLRRSSIDVTLPHHSCNEFKASEADETIDELSLIRLDWIKINGGDDAVCILRGAADTLWRLRPRLLVTATSHEDIAHCVDAMHDLGYICWQKRVPLFNPNNFNQQVFDVFHGRSTEMIFGMPEERADEWQPSGARKFK